MPYRCTFQLLHRCFFCLGGLCGRWCLVHLSGEQKVGGLFLTNPLSLSLSLPLSSFGDGWGWFWQANAQQPFWKEAGLGRLGSTTLGRKGWVETCESTRTSREKLTEPPKNPLSQSIESGTDLGSTSEARAACGRAPAGRCGKAGRGSKAKPHALAVGQKWVKNCQNGKNGTRSVNGTKD